MYYVLHVVYHYFVSSQARPHNINLKRIYNSEDCRVGIMYTPLISAEIDDRVSWPEMIGK